LYVLWLYVYAFGRSFFFYRRIESSQPLLVLLVYTYVVPNLPIYSASFLGDTGSVVVSGRRKFFYIYDAIAGSIDKVPGICGREEKSLEKHVVSPDGKLIAFIGNDGFIILVEASSKLWVGNLKMNGSCRSLCFNPDGKEMLSSGSDGDV
jgi:U3 small nucleolar RNA-associated protein 18